MLPIQWRAEAQADLAAILDYVVERNPQSASTCMRTSSALFRNFRTIHICTA
jgi:plasmid stabilization system protein ParE